MNVLQNATPKSFQKINAHDARATLRRKRIRTSETVLSTLPNSLPPSVLPPIRSDSDLVQRAVSGDATALEQLLKAHTAKLYRTAFRVLRNKEDAEDAMQECCLRAYNKLASFERRSSFSTWLTRILINSALMILRKNRCAREVSLDAFEERGEVLPFHRIQDAFPNPEQRLLDCERKETINKAIDGLRPTVRKVFEFCQLGHSVEETSRAHGISMAAVKSRLHQGRAKLRKSFRRQAIVRPASQTAA